MTDKKKGFLVAMAIIFFWACALILAFTIKDAFAVGGPGVVVKSPETKQPGKPLNVRIEQKGE